jgi:hypothetical protein
MTPSKPSPDKPQRMQRKVYCDHCGKLIVKGKVSGDWIHDDTGRFECRITHATPKEIAND